MQSALSPAFFRVLILLLQMSDCILLGDNEYLSQNIQLNLFNEVKIELETSKRKNQKDHRPKFYKFKKYRKRIETLFSHNYVTSL